MPDEVVTVATFQSLPQAEACRLHLESRGLTVFLTDAEAIRTDWLLSNALGLIKVEVPGFQAEQAAQALEEIERQREQQAARTDVDYCLACGAVLGSDIVECSACGWSYTQGRAALDADTFEDEVD